MRSAINPSEREVRVHRQPGKHGDPHRNLDRRHVRKLGKRRERERNKDERVQVKREIQMLGEAALAIEQCQYSSEYRQESEQRLWK